MVASDRKHWEICDVWSFKESKHFLKLNICRFVSNRWINIVATSNKKFRFVDTLIGCLANQLVNCIEYHIR